MSFGGFGVSVGDAFAVGTVAWSIYKACKSAPAEFSEISKEVASLHTALREISDEEQNQDSILNRSGDQKQVEFQDILGNCRLILTELEQLLSKYGSLGINKGKGRAWDRLRFGAKDLGSIREKLIFQNTAISLFLQTLGTDSLGRIEKKLDELIQEVRNGQRETTTLMTFGERDEPEDVHWSGLETALKKDGISRTDLDTHKNGIRAYLQEQVEKFQLPIRTRRFLCKEFPPCNREFKRKFELARHIRMCHSENTQNSPSPTMAKASSLSHQGFLNSATGPSPDYDSRRHSDSFDDTCTEIEEYDGQGRLRKRTITRQSSNNSMNSNRASTPLTVPSQQSPFSQSFPIHMNWGNSCKSTTPEIVPYSSHPIEDHPFLFQDHPFNAPVSSQYETGSPGLDVDSIASTDHEGSITEEQTRKRKFNLIDRIRSQQMQEDNMILDDAMRIDGTITRIVAGLTQKIQALNKNRVTLANEKSRLEAKCKQITENYKIRERHFNHLAQENAHIKSMVATLRQENALLRAEASKTIIVRGHYKSERNFFKDVAVRLGWAHQERPRSPG